MKGGEGSESKKSTMLDTSRGEKIERGLGDISEALNELILVLIDKIIEKIDKQDLELEKLFKMLKDVVEIKKIFDS